MALYSGFPTGYIASLERRLLETEVALFDTMMIFSRYQQRQEHHSMTISDDAISTLLSVQSAHHGKISNLEEWGRLPLASHSSRLLWFDTKRADFEALASTKPTITRLRKDLDLNSVSSEPEVDTLISKPTREPMREPPPLYLASTISQSPLHSLSPSQFSRGSGQGQTSGMNPDAHDNLSATSKTVSSAQEISSIQWRRYF